MPDPIYIDARRGLLDALEALGPHRAAVILVGAQAIYLHTGEVDLAVAPLTTDADLALDPRALEPEPLLEPMLRAAGLVGPKRDPGAWFTSEGIPIDLMVPAALGGAGRRGARLDPHGNQAARKARGLEAALIDRAEHIVKALDPEDSREFEIAVAGPTALLVAKMHKIVDRAGAPTRASDKDALDVLRLLRAVETEVFVERLRALQLDPVAGEVTREAIEHARSLFGTAGSSGSRMAARSVGALEDPLVISQSCAILMQDCLSALNRG